MNADHPLFKALAGPLGRLWLGARRAAALPESGLRILTFHETPRDLHPIFKQLADRLRQECGLVDPRGAEALLGGGGGGAPGVRQRAPCLLSFDDGYRSNYRLAREVLEPMGLRALFFVCPGLVDLEPERQRRAIAENIRENPLALDNARFEQELMTWGEIRALATAGHAIGSHTWSHRRLSAIGGAEAEAEVGKAIDLLTARLGRPPRWFAFPFGNVESINSTALARVGQHHRFCRSGVRGINSPGTPALGLRSQAIDLRAPLDYQLAAAAGALDFRYRAARRELSSKLPPGDSMAAASRA
ncbi:MAG: polysaccharide deacetylase family protein [Elusimicrobia bacterium]|nr:polysaccharide deacetylase family protein [Elusimicrobiota bacterium]